MTSQRDPGESGRNGTSRPIRLPFQPQVDSSAVDPSARQAESSHRDSETRQSAHTMSTNEFGDSEDDPRAFEDESVSFANTLDKRAYRARRRLLITLVSLILLGSVLLIGRAVTLHLERTRAAHAALAPRARESRVEAVVAASSATSAFTSQTQEHPAAPDAVNQPSITSDSEATRGAPAVKAAVPSVASPTASSASNRQALSGAPRRKRAVHTNKPKSYSEAETESGIPIDQIYVNKRGDLVDAQGKPLHAVAPSPNDAASVP